MPNDTQVSAQPSAPVASPEPMTSTATESPSVEAILNFDPFGPEEVQTDTTVVEAAPAATTDVTGDGSSAAPQPQPTQPQDVAPVANPEMDLLKKQHKEALEELAKLKAGTPQATEPKPQPKPEMPSYEFEIPEPLVAALQSEDPKEVQMGVRNLAQGVAQGIHQTILHELETKYFPRMIAASVQANQQHAQTTEQTTSMRKDFYGSFPELDKPELHPIIGLVAGQLAIEMGVQGYSQEFKAALRQRLTALGVGAAKAPAPAPAPVPQPMITQGATGNRPTPTFADEQQKQMMELFDV